jgi:N-acetylglucosaminyldiphosphoundecaprenol N-acetyl-beta-D-mannosaminyltransferase
MEFTSVPVDITIFGCRTKLIETADSNSLAARLAAGPGASVFFCNVHMLMLAQDDPVLASAMDEADWVFADGVPIAWLQRRMTGKSAQVIRGYEMMLAICARAANHGETVGFLGSTQNVINQLVGNLTAQFENLKVAFQYSPPFTENEIPPMSGEIEAIQEAELNWLFIGLGCPKQEKWIAKYSQDLNCNVLGVGAAFDWLSGSVKKPPEWMERSGLGWLYRLARNPTKLWRRYLVFNTRFLLRVGKRLLTGNTFE